MSNSNRPHGGSRDPFESPLQQERKRQGWKLFNRREYAKEAFGDTRYSMSPYANPRKPNRKPYHEMSRMEQRIYKKMRLASWLGAAAGVGAGVIITLLWRWLA